MFISPLQPSAVQTARYGVRFDLSNALKNTDLLALQEAQNRRNPVKIEHLADSSGFHFLLWARRQALMHRALHDFQ